jgi:long-chain acyl-CoA synthetase
MYEIQRFTIPELIEKSARRYAARPFLAMVEGTPIRFEEIEGASRRVSAILAAYGAKQGDRVAIVSENRPEWGISFLGLSRLGCIGVPILTDFTAEQIGNILEHSESRIVFLSKRFVPKLAAAAAGRIFIAIEDFSLVSGPAGTAGVDPSKPGLEDLLLPEVEAEDLAAIIYTSGTTGLSKGVMLTHRNIVFDAWACRRFIILKRTDRFLSILPLAHAYEFTIGFIIPLMQGSAIYYLDRPPSATALLPALKAIRPTVMLSVPLVIEKIYRSSVKPALEKIGLYRYPAFRPLLQRVAGLKLMKTFGGKIRFFGIGGAPLAHDVEAFLARARFPYAIGYGLTETAPMVAGRRHKDRKIYTTGYAATNVEMRIAAPRPDDGAGEIQVRGANVFPGYYKAPDRTAEAFSEDGWFRTGDLGTMDAKGIVTVRGRLKTMILGASGENIYPEEVEAVVNSSPFVQESLVYGDESGLTVLVQLKPEILEEVSARVKDGIEEAEEAATRLGHAVGEAIGHAGESLSAMERAAGQMLEGIKKEANARLAAFSRIGKVKIQVEPFEKTPTQKIKRFLYPQK